MSDLQRRLKGSIIIEDVDAGTTAISTLEKFAAENSDLEGIVEIVETVRAGKDVKIGGGAAPILKVRACTREEVLLEFLCSLRSSDCERHAQTAFDLVEAVGDEARWHHDYHLKRAVKLAAALRDDIDTFLNAIDVRAEAANG